MPECTYEYIIVGTASKINSALNHYNLPLLLENVSLPTGPIILPIEIVGTCILSHSMTLLKLTLNKLTITDADLTIPLVALLGNTANSRFNSSPFVGAGNSTYLRGLNYTQIIQPGRP